MVEQVTFQTIFQFLQTVGILVGVFYYIMTIRTNQRNQEISLKNQELTLQSQEQSLETRQAQLFMTIYSKFYDKGFMKDLVDIILNWGWENYDDFMEKYGPWENPESYSTFTACNDYFEGIGVLVKRNLIEASLIDDLVSGLVMMYWDKTESIIREIRVRQNYPQFSEYFEYLYNEVKIIAEEQHPELNL